MCIIQFSKSLLSFGNTQERASERASEERKMRRETAEGRRREREAAYLMERERERLAPSAKTDAKKQLD